MELMVVIDRVLQILIAAEKNVFNYQVVGFLAPHLVLLIQSLDLFSYGFKRNEKHIRCFRCSFFFSTPHTNLHSSYQSRPRLFQEIIQR